MAEQTEKAYLKQPKVFLSSKKTGKGKRPGKGGNRFCKNIGLGFKTPREAVEGTYIDKKCQFTGTLSVRGRILAGTSHSTKMMRTIGITFIGSRNIKDMSRDTPITLLMYLPASVSKKKIT